MESQKKKKKIDEARNENFTARNFETDFWGNKVRMAERFHTLFIRTRKDVRRKMKERRKQNREK